MIDDIWPPERERIALANCFRSLGTERFYKALLRYAEAICGFEHLSVFKFSAHLLPHIEVLEGLDDPSITSRSARSYLGFGYYGSDPARLTLREMSLDADLPVVFVMRAQDITDAAYRRDIYDKFGLDGRVSLIARAGDHWRSINFYKHSSRGPLNEADVGAVTTRAQILFAAEHRHVELVRERNPSSGSTNVPSLHFLLQLLMTIAPALSQRETEVCARALQGMTGEGTALDLNVTEATVATLRRRAYAKIGISNVNELFALCLAGAARSDELQRRSDSGAPDA